MAHAPSPGEIEGAKIYFIVLVVLILAQGIPRILATTAASPLRILLAELPESKLPISLGQFRRRRISGPANLFLLNPAGILFGQTARLNVGGSFHATTADYIKLGTEGVVYADPAKASPQIGKTLTQVAVSGANVNGFAQVLHYNGQPGFVEASKVRPFRSEIDAALRCTIAGVRPNGSPVFDIR